MSLASYLAAPPRGSDGNSGQVAGRATICQGGGGGGALPSSARGSERPEVAALRGAAVARSERALERLARLGREQVARVLAIAARLERREHLDHHAPARDRERVAAGQDRRAVVDGDG